MKPAVGKVFLPLALSYLWPAVSTAQDSLFTFGAGQITVIGAGQSSELYLKGNTVPTIDDSGPAGCPGGGNNGFVQIPSGNDAMKALALSIYFSGHPGSFHVTGGAAGCAGAYRIVTQLYASP